MQKLGELTSPVEGPSVSNQQFASPTSRNNILGPYQKSHSLGPPGLFYHNFSPHPRVLPNRPVVDHQARAQRHLQLPRMGGSWNLWQVIQLIMAYMCIYYVLYKYMYIYKYV